MENAATQLLTYFLLLPYLHAKGERMATPTCVFCVVGGRWQRLYSSTAKQRVPAAGARCTSAELCLVTGACGRLGVPRVCPEPLTECPLPSSSQRLIPLPRSIEVLHVINM